MLSELKLLVAVLRSEKENSQKEGTPVAGSSTAEPDGLRGGCCRWVFLWSFSGCVSDKNEEEQQPMIALVLVLAVVVVSFFLEFVFGMDRAER
jgi:hypothetical protein